MRCSRSEARFASFADSSDTIEVLFERLSEGTVSGWWWCVCSARSSFMSSAKLVAKPVLTVRSEFSFV